MAFSERYEPNPCNLEELITALHKAYERAFEPDGEYKVIWCGCEDGSVIIRREWPNGYKFIVAEIWPEGVTKK